MAKTLITIMKIVFSAPALFYGEARSVNTFVGILLCNDVPIDLAIYLLNYQNFIKIYFPLLQKLAKAIAAKPN